MKYPYKVKHNGVWYPAGVEVPTGDTSPLDADRANATNAEKPVADIPAKKRVGRRPKI